MFFIHGRLVKILTFGFAAGLTLFPFILMLEAGNRRIRNHELIHIRQQLEMLLAALPVIGVGVWLHSSWWLLGLVIHPFYLWYLIEYLIHLIRFRDSLRAYYNISFEQEANDHQTNLAYLVTRRPFAWLQYVGRDRRWPFSSSSTLS